MPGVDPPIACGTGACAGTQDCVFGFWADCSTRDLDCGICCMCEDNNDPDEMFDAGQGITDCAVYGCDPLDTACADYTDVQYCTAIGVCADDNTDCNDVTYEIIGVECDSNYLCSNTGGGDDNYDVADFTLPSLGYCDGAGGCD